VRDVAPGEGEVVFLMPKGAAVALRTYFESGIPIPLSFGAQFRRVVQDGLVAPMGSARRWGDAEVPLVLARGDARYLTDAASRRPRPAGETSRRIAEALRFAFQAERLSAERAAESRHTTHDTRPTNESKSAPLEPAHEVVVKEIDPAREKVMGAANLLIAARNAILDASKEVDATKLPPIALVTLAGEIEQTIDGAMAAIHTLASPPKEAASVSESVVPDPVGPSGSAP
jgi:hypothetical protein